ncbi:MAG: hypothetical protein GXO72_04595 [Caldiserica bacterium]|nr:hypothetical protein [Caldisericota bacterium]
MAERRERPVGAFVLSLLAGIWMAGAGIAMYGWVGPVSWMWGHGMMGGYAGWPRLPWLGLVFGVVVLVGAAMLYSRPEKSQGWGIAILVVSAVNLLFGMGGVLASLLGIVGGAWAVAWSPSDAGGDGG